MSTSKQYCNVVICVCDCVQYMPDLLTCAYELWARPSYLCSHKQLCPGCSQYTAKTKLSLIHVILVAVSKGLVTCHALIWYVSLHSVHLLFMHP